jgi:ADP-ribose pyrophosphatase YjhB (NUDIX family)
VKGPHKRMLLELPTADEIDELAITTPELIVRKFEHDISSEVADLNYPPCKGQVVLVAMGQGGTVLVKEKGSTLWSLPTGRISPMEKPADAARRIASSSCGLHLRTLELVGMYDVTRHYSNLTVKRLYVVFRGLTEDTECRYSDDGSTHEADFFGDDVSSMLQTEMDRNALADSMDE